MRERTGWAEKVQLPIDTGTFFYRVRAPARDRPLPDCIAAGVVELVDTLGLGPSGGDAVGVQVPPPAPNDEPETAPGPFLKI